MTEGFHWTQECIPLGKLTDVGFDTSEWVGDGQEAHNCQNAFLLDGEESLLFDTLTRSNGDAVVDLLDLLEGGSEGTQERLVHRVPFLRPAQYYVRAVPADLDLCMAIANRTRRPPSPARPT